MNNFAFIWVSIILLLGIGSTAFLFYKLHKLQTRVESEMNGLEKELLDEVKLIGELDKTESGRKLKEMILSEQPKYFDVSKAANKNPPTVPSLDSLKIYALIAVICAVVFALIRFAPKPSIGIQTLIPFLWLTVGVFVVTAIVQIVFPVEVYEKVRVSNFSTENKRRFAYTVESLYQVKTKGFKADRKYWWHLTWFNTTFSAGVSAVVVFWTVIIVVIITLAMLLIIGALMSSR